MDVVQKLLAKNLTSPEKVHSAVSKLVVSPYIQAVTKDTARIILPLVTTKEIGKISINEDIVCSTICHIETLSSNGNSIYIKANG